MTSENELVLCYNKGCAIKFDAGSNKEDSCSYHPGAPIFHDAYKGWSCCKKRSTDFTTFLNMEGCTKGFHNPIKPEVEKKPTISSDKDDVIVVEAPRVRHLPRPNLDATLNRLKLTVTQSLTSALDAEESKEDMHIEEKEEIELGVQVGESCKNNGCKATYEGEESDFEECRHHPGYPVFHEGMKFWTCCNKKTSDFNSFLEQEGCSKNLHVWVKESFHKANCRYDWHQTGTHICVTLYAKLSQPDSSYVEANAIRLKPHIVFGENHTFDSDWELQGVINPVESGVSMAATKVEINLRKAEPKKWSDLYVLKKEIQKENKTISTEPEVNDLESNLDIDGVNLDDI